MAQYLWLIPLGFLVSTFGTLIGAGGGFILVPILLLMYPQYRPDTITSISLAVVFCNALSGTWAYARMQRVDFRAGWMFAAATVPGAVLGAMTTVIMPRRTFDLIFGCALVAVSIYLLIFPEKPKKPSKGRTRQLVSYTVVESDGTVHALSYNPRVGLVISVFVGYMSSLLGIGGGIIHVPAMVQLLGFPVHIATATSIFILAIMTLAGTIVHIATGALTQVAAMTAFIAVGVLGGAQLGAYLSQRIKGPWIIRSLALALGSVGLRILFKAL